MRKVSVRNLKIVLPLIAISLLGLLLLINREKPSQKIGGLIEISSNGKSLAMFICPVGQWMKAKLFYIPNLLEEPNKPIKLKKIKKNILGFAWRPRTSPQEFFIGSYDDTGIMTISAVKLLGNKQEILHQTTLPKNFTIRHMSWNSDGQILAVLLTKWGKGVGLGFIRPNDKNINIMEMEFESDSPQGLLAWANENTLYVQDGNDILELHIENKKAQVKERHSFDEEIYLCCSFNSKPVYIKSNNLYCGNQRLYESNKKITWAVADGEYLAIQEEYSVIVLNDKGEVINRQHLGKGGGLITLSSQHKFIYFLKNFQRIERYNFAENDRIYTIYDVNQYKPL